MNTNSNKNFGTTFFALAFIVAVFFEFYFIMTNPYNYFMLIGIGIIMIILGYLTFDSIYKAKAATQRQLNEQNEMMLKASKAIYLATKRNTQEAQKQHTQNIKAIEYMMNTMISSEKEMVTAMISKNEEIAAKQLTEKSANNDMSSLIEQLSASNARLAKEVQAAVTVNELVKANADLVQNVREIIGNSRVTSDNVISESKAVQKADEDLPINDGSPEYTATWTSDMEQEPDEFDFESFEIPDEAEDVQISDEDTATSKEIVDDVNISVLNDMVETEGNTVAPEISTELDNEMSSVSNDTTFDNSNDNPNQQLTEEEIAALFANL